MTKFICKKCGMIWFTANTKKDQKCDNCDELLTEYDDYIYEMKLSQKSS